MKILAADASSPLNFWSYFIGHRSDVLSLLWTHTWLSVVPVIVGLLLALPVGWFAAKRSWAYPPIMSLSGILYTIPSIGLFVMVPVIFGFSDPLTPWQVPIALTVYSFALLVRVVADGLASVSKDTLQAATALGYTAIRRFGAVEMPIALPVITAGLRVAVVSNVSIVAVAGTIGMRNLGTLFQTGYQESTNGPYYPPIVLGLILCLALALLLDVLLQALTRAMTPWRKAVR